MHNVELYRDDAHLCVLLNESEELDEGGIHSNQFLILHQEFGVLLDPGGFGVMPDVLDAMLAYCEPEQIRYIVCCQQIELSGFVAHKLSAFPGRGGKA